MVLARRVGQQGRADLALGKVAPRLRGALAPGRSLTRAIADALGAFGGRVGGLALRFVIRERDAREGDDEICDLVVTTGGRHDGRHGARAP